MPARAAERRPDPTVKGGKKTYTKQQFIDFYGKKNGAKVWQAAGKGGGPKKAGAPKKAEERRRDPSDKGSKKTYTRAEFVAFYGKKNGTRLWELAAPREKVPKTMRALVQSDYGDYSKGALELRADHPVPEFDPKGSSLLVKVYAAAVNPIDYKLGSGMLRKFLGELPMPRVPCYDVCGVVVRKGKQCVRVGVGERIFADSAKQGTAAEYVLVDEKCATRAPSNLSALHSAAIPLAGLTSYQALKTHGGLQKGGKVLVLGGSGGTGTFALQIAKALGAAFIATTSSNEELCAKLGAHQVVNYKKGEKFAEVLAGKELDLVFDCVGGDEGWAGAQKVLKPGGSFVTIVHAGPPKPEAEWNGFKWASMWCKSDEVKDLVALRKMAESKKLKPVIDPSSPYSLEDGQKCFEYFMSNRAKGKVVFKVPAAKPKKEKKPAPKIIKE